LTSVAMRVNDWLTVASAGPVKVSVGLTPLTLNGSVVVAFVELLEGRGEAELDEDEAADGLPGVADGSGDGDAEGDDVGCAEGEGEDVAEGEGEGEGACTVTVTLLLATVVPASSMLAPYVTACAVESLCEKEATPVPSVVAVPTAAPSAVNVTTVLERGLPLASFSVAVSVKASLTLTSEGPVRVSVGGGAGVGVGVAVGIGVGVGVGVAVGVGVGVGVGVEVAVSAGGVVAVARGSVLDEACDTVASWVAAAALVFTVLSAPLP
jgi:hypothetical protein